MGRGDPPKGARTWRVRVDEGRRYAQDIAEVDRLVQQGWRILGTAGNGILYSTDYILTRDISDKGSDTSATRTGLDASQTLHAARRETAAHAYCTNCGTQLDPTMSFCPSCGFRATQTNDTANASSYSNNESRQILISQSPPPNDEWVPPLEKQPLKVCSACNTKYNFWSEGASAARCDRCEAEAI